MSTLLLPHQKRVVAERDNLFVRVTKLRQFIASDEFRLVDRAERQRLIHQEAVMTEFVQVLDDRIEAFTAEVNGKGTDRGLSGEGACEACQ